MWSINSIAACSVDRCFRNPYWCVKYKLFDWKWLLSCWRSAFSKILENVGKMDIGL